MKYKTDEYLITCLTNLHVGSGGANYGVIDNLVQRDPVTDMPVIHSSSLKGALREFFKNEWGKCDDKLSYIFGPDDSRIDKDEEKDEKGNKCKKESGIGHYKFFNADLLVLPVRSNKKPFYRATAKILVDTINAKAKAFNGKDLIIGSYNKNEPTVMEQVDNLKLEDWPASVDNSLKNDKNMGNDVAVFDTDTFKSFAKKLPVIARNQLENGESKNLWYEEVVPRESRFVFFVSYPENDDNYKANFDEALENAVVQIGASGSIGYGYCKIIKI